MKPAKRAAPPARAAGRQRTLKTLDRILSKAGIASRTQAREWIARGRLKVNGKTTRDPECWVDPDRDEVLFDGKPVRPRRKLHIVLYKPKGYLTTLADPDGRPTVYELLRGLGQWVFPVGRLDLDTSGLLLLTNDSKLAESVTNPEYKVPKTYLVKSSTLLTDEQLDQLRQGVTLSDGPTRPALVRRLRDSGQRTFLEITITEGRNRQVRRMFEAIGCKVLKLVRTSIGPLSLGGLVIGRWRPLTQAEVRALIHAARPPVSGRKL